MIFQVSPIILVLKETGNAVSYIANIQVVQGYG